MERAASRELLSTGSILLGTEMKPGNYTLQVNVTDNNAKGSRATTTQFLSFEIVE
jgi:hypothetical protein